MKVQLLSDLHLERDPSYRAEPAAGADVLVLAGDVGSYQGGSRLADPDFGLAQFSPGLHPQAWRTVLYVPGNHEYDGLEFEPARARLQQTCARLGITWLEREAVVIGRTRFVGTTLWSDFDALVPLASAGASPASLLARQFDQREKAFRAANFYLRKHSALRDGKPMLADAWRELSLESQQWLRDQLNVGFDGTTVVVTTHAMANVELLDLVVLLKEGHVVYVGPPTELLAFFDSRSYEGVFKRLAAEPASHWLAKFVRSPLFRQFVAAR